MSGLFNVEEGLVAALAPDAGVGQPESADVQLATSIDILDENGNGIGLIEQINDNDNRPTRLVRHIGSVDAGQVIEQAPGFDTVTINVSGFKLYNKQEDGSVVQRIGGGSTRKAMKMLAEQKAGFMLLVTEKHPATGIIVDATLYMDCWITSKSKSITVRGDNTIMENAALSVSRAVRPDNFQDY